MLELRENTLYYGDCLAWMSRWEDQSVDLIYLDPPFNSNATYNVLYAGDSAPVAQGLHDRGHDPHRVAHFVNRLVFCMFADDVGLLPGHMFTCMLEQARRF